MKSWTGIVPVVAKQDTTAAEQRITTQSVQTLIVQCTFSPCLEVRQMPSEQPRDGVEHDKEPTKQELREIGAGIDPALGPEERETTFTAPNDTDYCLFFSEIPTHIKWVLSVEESKLLRHRIYSDDEVTKVVAVKAEIPKGIIKLQKSARKSDTNSDMVSYGPNG